MPNPTRRGVRRLTVAAAAAVLAACATAHPAPNAERASGDTLRLQMPVWSPGRYARMDFARNVRDESVQDGNGRAVRFDRENGSLWRIYPAGATHVIVRYRVFADNLSGTFSVL